MRGDDGNEFVKVPEVLVHYMRMFDFTEMELDTALRYAIDVHSHARTYMQKTLLMFWFTTDTYCNTKRAHMHDTHVHTRSHKHIMHTTHTLSLLLCSVFVRKFRMPGEAQKIDRIMHAFAERYYAMNCGADCVLTDASMFFL